MILPIIMAGGAGSRLWPLSRQLNHSTPLDMDFVRVNTEAFYNCPEDSIDYAVMEKDRDSAGCGLE